MFCYQCQEAANNTACTTKGMCGKDEGTPLRMDLLVYGLKRLAYFSKEKARSGASINEEGAFIMRGLFAMITNANFDDTLIEKLVDEAARRCMALEARFGGWDAMPRAIASPIPGLDDASIPGRVSILATEDEDLRSLREFIIYGLKGLAAYAVNAAVLGYEDEDIYLEVIDAIVATALELDTAQLTEVLVGVGHSAVKTMALLDKANTDTYGHPEITEVNIGTRNRPGILVSGHDLKDIAELLEQSKDSGVDIYTHSEMLPAHYYPAFKKYDHFVGNYGGSWYKQGTEFVSFNGPILMTTNCITPVKSSYKDRIFTTGMAGYPGVPHIEDRSDGKGKDFSALIELAQHCEAPKQIEEGSIVGGFAHHQIELLADKVVDAVKSGAVRKFVVMAGCDGRMKSREYFTDMAKALPKDTIIMTAGCAKYRYNKLDLGDIGGIPRVLDSGQCNDSYSIAATALKLKDIFELDDINDLPVDFAVGWYEQKAVCVLLALLALGFKGVRIGPTLPAFVSPNVANVIIDAFDLKATGDVKADLAAIVG